MSMCKCKQCQKEITQDRDGVWIDPKAEQGMRQYCLIDPIYGIAFHQPFSVQDHLDEYSKERGTLITVPNLITSHRNLIKELQAFRTQSLEDIKATQEKVEKMAMDSTWIKIEDLKKMTLQELANRLAD